MDFSERSRAQRLLAVRACRCGPLWGHKPRWYSAVGGGIRCRERRKTRSRPGLTSSYNHSRMTLGPQILLVGSGKGKALSKRAEARLCTRPYHLLPPKPTDSAVSDQGVDLPDEQYSVKVVCKVVLSADPIDPVRLVSDRGCDQSARVMCLIRCLANST